MLLSVRTTLAAAGACLTLAAQAQTPAAPSVDKAWARPTVAGQSAGGAFMTINGAGAADRLLSVKSDAAQTVELHTMSMDGSTMRMRRIDGIDVAAGQKVELKPGGMHVMFMGLKQPLQAGTTVPLVLKFKEGGDVSVDVQVMATAPGTAVPAASAATGHEGHKH